MSIQKPSYVKFHGIAEATFSRQQLILIVLHAQIGAIIMLFVKYRLCEWMKPLTEWMLINGVNPRCAQFVLSSYVVSVTCMNVNWVQVATISMNCL